MWRTARESVTELKRKRKRNESNLDFMSSYPTRNLDSFYVPCSCFSLRVHAKPSGCFLKFGPKRRLQSEYILLSRRGGTSHTAFLLSFSVLTSQRFLLPSSFEHFRFLFVKQARVLKYCIYSYSNKRQGAYRISSVTLQVRRLFEGGIYLKVGRDKEM